MSLNSGTNPDMSCADFEQSFNQYVDDMLEPAVAAAARRHCSKCTTCNREVMRWQQTRILLSTAVADFATAVDLSSVRSGVHAALGFADDTASERTRGGEREAAYDRGHGTRHAAGRLLRGSRGARRSARSSDRRGAFGAALRAASAAAVSAAVAAIAVVSFSPEQTGTMVASAPSQPQMTSSGRSGSRSMFQPASFRLGSRGLPEQPATTYTRPPLAKPETARVDGLEAAAGHMASTWVQPRTNARVIWVQDRGVGAPIRTAGLDR